MIFGMIKKKKKFGLVLWQINHCRLFNTKSIFRHINSSITNNSVQHKYNFLVYTQLNVKIILFQTFQFSINTQFQCQRTVLFQTIQFSISTQFSSIWPTDRTLLGATTLGQSEPGSDGNEGVLCIPQSSSITGTSLSDYLVSCPGHLLGGGLTLLWEAGSVLYSLMYKM